MAARVFNKLLLWIPKLGNYKNGDWSTAEEAEKFYRDLGTQGGAVR
jgi:hypothetical protein